MVRNCVSTQCPVVLCPHLCTSDSRRASARSKRPGPRAFGDSRLRPTCASTPKRASAAGFAGCRGPARFVINSGIKFGFEIHRLCYQIRFRILSFMLSDSVPEWIVSAPPQVVALRLHEELKRGSPAPRAALSRAQRACGFQSEKGGALPRGVGALRYVSSSVTTLVVKCPSVQWQPDGLTIHTKK